MGRTTVVDAETPTKKKKKENHLAEFFSFSRFARLEKQRRAPFLKTRDLLSRPFVSSSSSVSLPLSLQSPPRASPASSGTPK